MLRKTLLTALIICTSINYLDSQVLIGSVTNSDNNPIGFAIVEDTLTKNKRTCDFLGNFILALDEQTVIKITHPEYEGKEFTVSPLKKSDTIFLNFVLTEKVQLVPEVIVTSDRLQRVTDQKNVNIVDYLPFKDFILTIKTVKSQRILGVEGVDTTLQEFNLGKIKAKSLVEDCFGNVHLLTRDSSYQIWIDTSLHIVSTSSIEKFNKLLKPCVANFSENNVFYSFTNHNRKFALISIDKKTKEKDYFFQLHDKIGEKVARSYYWSIISCYNQNIPEYANMIALGVWDGNPLTLNFSSPEFDSMIIWYLKIRGVELNIQAFQNGNKLLILDQFSDSIHIFDEKNTLLKNIYYSFPKGSTVFPVIQDRCTDIIYVLSKAQGIYNLAAINPSIDNNIQPSELTISEVPFAVNIKIFNGWVFFLIEENGFYGLHRIKMNTTLGMKQTER